MGYIWNGFQGLFWERNKCRSKNIVGVSKTEVCLQILTYWLTNKYRTSIDNQGYPKIILGRLPRPVCRWNGIWQPGKMQLLQKKGKCIFAVRLA
jgi:hypothetical protein